MVVTVVFLFVICFGACEANKRILLEDNAIVQRLEALETKSQIQDSKIANLERENGKSSILLTHIRRISVHCHILFYECCMFVLYRHECICVLIHYARTTCILIFYMIHVDYMLYHGDQSAVR